MTEFELIARYFDRPLPADAAVSLGIGDDCALLAPAPEHALAISTDMLVSGRHFFADADPVSIGWKTLAVNLSDLAAMGARPLAFTLALALPAVDEAWLTAFCRGLFACAGRFGCSLVGGDTTRGPLTLAVTVFGEVPDGAALRRSGARPGDDVWVSGVVGSAALALLGSQRWRGGTGPAVDPALSSALDRPVPRIALGIALRGVAHAAIDVSDGLAQDLSHILAASGCGADLDVDAIPRSAAFDTVAADERDRTILAGGDDYELCFTAPASRRAEVLAAGAATDTPVARIGTVHATRQLRLLDAAGEPWRPEAEVLHGYDHFA
jgi:thiamine-monophosphate kinase